MGDAHLFARQIDKASEDYKTAEALDDPPIPPQVRASKSGAFPEAIEQRLERTDAEGAMRIVRCTGSNRHGSPGWTLASKRTPICPATAPGARSARMGVPSNPVSWQKTRYSGTEAKARPTIATASTAMISAVRVFFWATALTNSNSLWRW